MADIKVYMRRNTRGWALDSGAYPCVVDRLMARRAHILLYSGRRRRWDRHTVDRSSLRAPSPAERALVEQQLVESGHLEEADRG